MVGSSRTTRQIAYSDGERVRAGNDKLRHQHIHQRSPTGSVGSQPQPSLDLSLRLVYTWRNH
ncbi:hypothetical protein K439DRAFT_863226 [Ramaria rubella]|nr:hypothetical protein K439DRAFT_863226 [Ramaria rubella]